jgi:hypothetical protein
VTTEEVKVGVDTEKPSPRTEATIQAKKKKKKRGPRK